MILDQTEAGLNILYQYGAIGVCLVVAYWFILRLIKSHEKEREEWKKTTDRQFELMNNHTEKTTSVLSDIKSLIQTLKK